MFKDSTLNSNQCAVTNSTVSILVVEDEPELRELVTEFLTDEGYNTVSASNGDSALELIKENLDISLIFTDIRMPGCLDGIEMAREARKLRPNIHIVVASGYSDHTHGSKSFDFTFLPKPYRLGDLVDKINSFLSNIVNT